MVRRISWKEITQKSKQKAIDDINAMAKAGSKHGKKVSGDEYIATDRKGWSRRKGYRKIADIPAWAFVVAQAKYGVSLMDPKIFKRVFRPFLTVPSSGIGNAAWRRGRIPTSRGLTEGTRNKIILPWE